jgi:hypothetical protein
LQQVQKWWHLSKNPGAAEESKFDYEVKLRPRRVLGGKDNPPPDVVDYDDDYYTISLQIPLTKTGR